MRGRRPLPTVATIVSGRVGLAVARRLASSLVQVDRAAASPVAVLKLARPPANSLSLEFMAEVRLSLAELEADPEVRGVVLSSSNPKIFSAGLDLKELVDPDPVRLHAFWTEMQTLCQSLFLTPLATVAAIHGHSPAGGCVLALTCDARVMREGGPRIGLNESALGLNAPWWICNLMERAIGTVKSEQMLQRGSLVDGTEAAKLGLVCSSAATSDEVDALVAKHMKEMLAVPNSARQAVKAQRRQALGDAMKSGTAEGSDWFVSRVTSPEVQGPIQAYVASLKK